MAISGTDQLSKAERDQRLDALKTAVTEWHEKERQRLEDEVTFLKSVLKRRTGAGRLAAAGVQKSKDYLVQQISQFLEG